MKTLEQEIIELNNRAEQILSLMRQFKCSIEKVLVEKKIILTDHVQPIKEEPYQ